MQCAKADKNCIKCKRKKENKTKRSHSERRERKAVAKNPNKDLYVIVQQSSHIIHIFMFYSEHKICLCAVWSGFAKKKSLSTRYACFFVSSLVSRFLKYTSKSKTRSCMAATATITEIVCKFICKWVNLLQFTIFPVLHNFHSNYFIKRNKLFFLLCRPSEFSPFLSTWTFFLVPLMVEHVVILHNVEFSHGQQRSSQQNQRSVLVLGGNYKIWTMIRWVRERERVSEKKTTEHR